MAAERDHLHQVVDDDVAQRANRVVEVAAVFDAEVFRHRDLDRRQVVAAPDRLEHRVREPQMDDLVDAHLSEVVVDPVELRFVDVRVQLVGKRTRRSEVVAERLLDDDPGVLRQSRLGQALDDPAEEERRNLEIEDRRRRALDRLCHAFVRRRLPEVARNVGEALGQAAKDVFVELLAGADDRFARPVDQAVHRPIVDRHAKDRAIQQAPQLEPVERPEGHHLREVARDSENHEVVRACTFGWTRVVRLWDCGRCVSDHCLPFHSSKPVRARSSARRRAARGGGPRRVR
jgi:hypothetical protein